MRGKRAKQYRKLMQQYGLAFGFREPYQVLGELDSGQNYQTRANVCSRRRYGARCGQIQDGLGGRLGADIAWPGQTQFVHPAT